MGVYRVPVRVVINGTAQVVLPDGSSQEEAEAAVRNLDLNQPTLRSVGLTAHVEVAEIEVEVV